MLGFAGCATNGPHHVYATLAASPAIHDLTASATIPRIIRPGERVAGLAYDFNTDHVFVRVAPAQVIRVIERPSGKILRTMPLPAELRTESPADLAIRSSDRHLFAVHGDRQSLVELSLYGEPLRAITLAGLAPTERIGGLAFDQQQSRLLALVGATIRAFDLNGAELARVTLEGAIVTESSLAYDSDAGHYFVPVDRGAALGEFDRSGHRVKIHPSPDGNPFTSVDAGRRSLVRVF